MSVCLLAFHPLALSELERRVAKGPFRATSRRFDVDAAGQIDPIAVPAAAVYVVETHSVPDVARAAITIVQKGREHARIIAAMERVNEAGAFPLLRWGVKGLIDFVDTIDQLPDAVREVAQGGFWVPRPILARFVEETLTSTRRPAAAPVGGRLSTREREVRDLLLENLSNREIGERLHMSERTVKFHVSNLLSKFGVKRRADLIVLAYSAEPAAAPQGDKS